MNHIFFVKYSTNQFPGNYLFNGNNTINISSVIDVQSSSNNAISVFMTYDGYIYNGEGE
jgi:hypothetical protein